MTTLLALGLRRQRRWRRYLSFLVSPATSDPLSLFLSQGIVDCDASDASTRIPGLWIGFGNIFKNDLFQVSIDNIIIHVFRQDGNHVLRAIRHFFREPLPDV